MSKLSGLYYVETGRGCTVVESKSTTHAYREVLREVGTDAGVQKVEKATMARLQWVAGMGGRLPLKARKLLEAQP